jgi:hypothetical protein
LTPAPGQAEKGELKKPALAADCLRYLVATKSRTVTQRKLRGYDVFERGMGCFGLGAD